MDLTGKKFGRLTVIQKTDKRASSQVVWLCRCDCGNMVEATTTHLTRGNTKSCGCARKGVNRIDLTGRKFGRLLVLFPTDKHLGNSVIWRCRCDCGNITEAASINLLKGNTRSCGCLASEVHRVSSAEMRKVRGKNYVYGTDLCQLQREPRADNTSGVVGVSYDKSIQRWKAHITFRGKRYYLGCSTDKEKVIALRKEAEERIHGEFLEWYHAEKQGEIDAAQGADAH